MKGYKVTSPDGFDLEMGKTYKTKEQAKKAFAKWVKRYQAQGHYTTGRWERIPFDEIADHCTIERLGGSCWIESRHSLGREREG
jgi:hypothetical protein